MACIDVGGITAQLLSLMISGEMPIDLKVTRHCCNRLAGGGGLPATGADASGLVQAVETLDAAILFAVPPKCLASLRVEALVRLVRLAGPVRMDVRGPWRMPHRHRVEA